MNYMHDHNSLADVPAVISAVCVLVEILSGLTLE